MCLSDRAYTHEQILVMEKIILGKLEWTLTVPTPFVFLVRFIKASVPDQEVSDIIYIFLNIWFLLHFSFLISCLKIFLLELYTAGKHDTLSF